MIFISEKNIIYFIKVGELDKNSRLESIFSNKTKFRYRYVYLVIPFRLYSCLQSSKKRWQTARYNIMTLVRIF